jgi:hypothetical protein
MAVFSATVPSNFSLALLIQSNVEIKGRDHPIQEYLWKRGSWATPICN